MAVLSQLEYRINFLIDVLVQPILSTTIEVTLWMAILTGMKVNSLGGFGREYYLAYTLWSTFVGRITINWMYEFKMLKEIESGSVNAILVRPISFYEYYLSQFMGYKVVVILTSISLPILACWYFDAPLRLERLPIAVCLLLYYLVFVHTLSFSVACLAFSMNRASSLTAMKNLAIWVLAGEMIPLDLYPEPFRTLLMHSPFAVGVYIPVSFVTGRIGWELFSQSFVSVTLGLVVLGAWAAVSWSRGVRAYTGTGA